jgi:hypothetical protein
VLGQAAPAAELKELLLDQVVLGFEESSAWRYEIGRRGDRLKRRTAGEGNDHRLDDHLKASKELADVKAATVALDCWMEIFAS